MNYSKNTNLLHSPLLEIPETINFNDTILIQTDKKITIPEIPNELGIIDKTTLQIKNESVEDNLKYIFYIPVQSDEEKEKILAGELVYDGEDTGQIVSIHIPDGPLGVGFTQEGIEGHNELVK
jgi:predicted peptidase